MEQIICEQGLWPDHGLNMQCDGFKLLFTQPDLINQKSHQSHLEELITSQSHLCDFYPKYHSQRRTSQNDINEMEDNVKACLNDIPDLQIKRLASLHIFIIFYLSANEGLSGDSGPESAWGNWKYHGHTADILADLKRDFDEKYGGGTL
ncbi:hypothetical protein BYT27DRAFT_7221952 [Phlegmacium glaucopus]|nr:hypothetical protein BYT27DRAFT_7221952 [Phlegmacium glaucopus]